MSIIDDGTTLSGVIDVDISTVVLNNKALRDALTSFAKDRKIRVYDKLFLGRRCDCRMYFHNPFFDERIDYDVNNDVGVSNPRADNLDQFIEWFRQLEFRTRFFSLNWPDGTDIYVACRSDQEPRPWPRTEPDRFYMSWETWLTADIARLCQGIPQYIDRNTSVDDISYETCIDLLRRCFDFYNAKLGTHPSLRLYTYLEVESGVPPVGPKVWDYWDCIWVPLKGHKVYKTPVDAGIVRAYPIVVIQYDDKRCKDSLEGELVCAVNCVHERGKTYVEVQARDIESIQFIADFYCASVDVWRGKLEDRFGWYGDAAKGTTYRIEPKTSASAFSGVKVSSLEKVVPALETVFVASPKLMRLCPDGKVRDACDIYQRPVVIGSTLLELHVKGYMMRLNLDGLIDVDEILQSTLGSKSFMDTWDWLQYPKEVQQKALELAGLGLNEPFPERIAKTKVWSKMTHEAQSKLVQLLNLGTHRITELSVTPEDRKKLSRAIGSKKVSQTMDQWIEGLLKQTGV